MRAESRGPLPSPQDRPGAAILIFDGHCRLCTGSMERLHRWDSQERLAYVSLHDPQAARLAPGFSHDDLMRAILLIDERGRNWRGARAFRVIARRIPRLWPLVPLLYVPGSLILGDWIYGLVARWRYRLGGTVSCDDGSCPVPGRFRPP